jgi:hypothetical protein
MVHENRAGFGNRSNKAADDFLASGVQVVTQGSPPILLIRPTI